MQVKPSRAPRHRMPPRAVSTVFGILIPPSREKSARIASVTLANPDDGHTSGEDEQEEEQAEVDDSEILEDLPDDTEVRATPVGPRISLHHPLGHRTHSLETELNQPARAAAVRA